MKAIAHIYAKDDGTFDLAAVPIPPADLAQILLALASAIIKRIASPAVDAPRVELVDSGIEGKPPTVVVDGGSIGPGERIEGIDGTEYRRLFDEPPRATE